LTEEEARRVIEIAAVVVIFIFAKSVGPAARRDGSGWLIGKAPGIPDVARNPA
jgi:hypothetical protein